VVSLETGLDRVAPVPTAPPPATTLQEVIRRKNMTLGATAPKKEAGPAAAGAAQVVEPAIDQAFHRILDGASITQYRLAGYGGKIRLLATANTEEAVFNTLAAAARAVADLGNQGKETTIDIVLTTSGGDSGGSFTMTPDQARQIVNGQLSAADYFLRNVIL